VFCDNTLSLFPSSRNILASRANIR
jgi:hypothetical protein